MAQSAKQKAAALKKVEEKKAAAKAAEKAAKALAVEAKKQEMAGPVVLNTKQEKTIEMIGKNQERILKDAVHMMDIAFDSGKRLLELKDQIKAKYSMGWKEWAESAAAAGTLAISYSQVTRYMGLARDPIAFEKVKAMGVTSVEDGLKQLLYIKKPEAQAADEAKAAAKAAKVPAAPKGAPVITISYAFDVLSALDIDELRQIQEFVAERIDELTQESNTIPGTAEEVDDDDTDAEDAAEHVGDVDPLS